MNVPVKYLVMAIIMVFTIEYIACSMAFKEGYVIGHREAVELNTRRNLREAKRQAGRNYTSGTSMYSGKNSASNIKVK